MDGRRLWRTDGLQKFDALFAVLRLLTIYHLWVGLTSVVALEQWSILKRDGESLAEPSCLLCSLTVQS